MATYELKTKDDEGTLQTRTYWCPADGGYVYETAEGRPGTLGRQVGEDLSHSGDMLTASEATLPDVIRQARRRELRALRAIY